MLKKISSYAFVVLGLMLLLNSCKKEYIPIENIDDNKIEEYIAKNHIAVTKDPNGTGFYYQVLSPGTGDLFVNTDSVRYSVNVKSLLNGNTYYTTPEITNLGTYVGYSSQLLGINIKGILQILQTIKPGGSFRIFLPSYLGFGKNGQSNLNIPSNEILDITVNTYAEKQLTLDEKKVTDFISEKGLTATKDPETGIYYVVTQQGTGTEVIDMASTLTLNYTGRFLDGTTFESSTDGTYTVELTQRMAGWEVLKNFKKGTKIRLIIPSVYAYGAAGLKDASGNAIVQQNVCLDYDIEIADVTN